MKKIIKALKIPTIVLLFITSFIACDKDFYVLGDNDVIGEDNANFNTNSRDLSIVSYNKKLDSIQINNLPSNLLGFFNDPEYGPTTASIITQIVPGSIKDFGENPAIDSVILSIPYYSRAVNIDNEGNTEYSINDSLYGNPVDDIKLSIYENKYFLRDFNPDNLEESQNYYAYVSSGDATSNYALTNNNVINFDNFKDVLIKDTIFTPSSKAIITLTTPDDGGEPIITRSVPALRIKLDNAFWESTILSKNGLPELSNTNNFKDYFRGLYFKAEPVDGKGNMVLLDFTSSDALITIHFSRDNTNNAGERMSDTYEFNFNGNRLNTFINEHTIAVSNGDREFGDETLYLKGGIGSMAVIDLFPTAEALNDFLEEFRIPEGDDYLKDDITGDYILRKLINEAHLLIYEEDNLNIGGDADFHKYDRIYAYDIENNAPTIDYVIDATDNPSDPLNSRVISLGQRVEDDKGFRYKIRLTEHINNILLRGSEASVNTKIGLALSTNVNLTSNAEILKSEDDVTGIPAATILTPKGTILHGTNSADPEKKMKLKLFFTESE